jgi:hypothetical protein
MSLQNTFLHIIRFLKRPLLLLYHIHTLFATILASNQGFPMKVSSKLFRESGELLLTFILFSEEDHHRASHSKKWTEENGEGEKQESSL